MFYVNCKYWGMRDEESFEFDNIQDAREFAMYADCMHAEVTDEQGNYCGDYCKF